MENETFSKNIFTKNFRSENEISVYPYCDIGEILLQGNSEIDHFMPQSSFPLVRMHPKNLILICRSCNSQYGKHTDYIQPICSLYDIQIGDKIKFIIKHSEKNRVNITGRKNSKLHKFIKIR